MAGVWLWGAQAPRVLVSATRRNELRRIARKKFAMTRASSPAREARALPKPVLTLQVIQATSGLTVRFRYGWW
jgi:hypothetical protein